MLITFSGLDGAGKSSLIAWLKDELERRGRAVTVLHMNRDVGRPGGWGWLRWLHRITPTPDVPVLLESSPEAAYARKGEYSLGYLRARETAYGAVFRWVERPLVLQASDLVTSKRALMRVVLGEPAH